MEEVKLQDRIDRVTREISESYMEALKAVDEVKRKMNELELSISEKGSAKASELANQLGHESDRLNELTDSLILKSGRAWEDYEKLEHDCKISAFEPAALGSLRDACTRTEQLAQDLLCYSLARFKRSHVE